MGVNRLIRLRGVRVHNLKGVDLDLPYRRLIALSGVSGSGKSSLAFDTLYAEGQRRYIETFSASARQFLDALDKPEADSIEGIPPAIAVAQGAKRRSARSTVGTVTEIHDHLALLFGRLGEVFCLDCGTRVEPSSPGTVAQAVARLPDRTRYQVAFPMEIGEETDRQALADSLRADGLLRVKVGGQVVPLEDGPVPEPAEGDKGAIAVIVDRLVRGADPDKRLLDSIETAFARGLGRCQIVLEDPRVLRFNKGWRCGDCGRDYEEPNPRLFRYQNPLGACRTCEGLGRVPEVDLQKIVPDPSKSIQGGAIAPWASPLLRSKLDDLLAKAPTIGLPTDPPFHRLTPAQRATLVEGDPARGFPGLRSIFLGRESKSKKQRGKAVKTHWQSDRPCPDCGGARLRPEALAVRVSGLDIAALSELRVREVLAFLDRAAEGLGSNPLARSLVSRAKTRLEYLERIGLGYLSLNRSARSLSGGEARRVSLTASLGSGLVNTLYVLDEPSAGLHPEDIGRLIDCLLELRDLGNTVVVVEHDLEVIRAADMLVDMGPGAGEAGGRVLYVGPPSRINPENAPGSATADFLSEKRKPGVPGRRRPVGEGRLVLSGARGHNLKNVDLSLPLGVLCVLTGVSGSGKSSLMEETLYPALRRRLGLEAPPGLPFDRLIGTAGLNGVVLVDASPIGRFGRSNPVTFLKAFDEIRKTFASTHEAKLRNYGAGRFSFNVEGGRCNACEGNGFTIVDMLFLPDVIVRCQECQGTRFRDETLQITYRGRNIAEVLDLSAREAFGFFRHRPKVQARLRPLLDVGLDYLRLGQPASTLSGGEAQRLKLASHLSTSPGAITRAAGGDSHSLFLLDEPATGLHPADTLKLLEAFESLLSVGHSLLVIEHAPEVLVAADWLIDLGPGAGDEGGTIVARGTPEEVATQDSPTGRALAKLLKA